MTLLLRLIPRNASHGIYRNTFYPSHTYFVILQEIETYLIDTKTHHFPDYRFFCGIYFRCLHFLSITPDHIKLMQTSIHLQPIEMNQLNLFIFLFKYYSNSFWFEAFLSVGLKYFLQLSFTFDSFVQKWYQIEKRSYFYSLESIRNWLTANWISLLILACHLCVCVCMGLCVCARSSLSLRILSVYNFNI